MNIKVEVPDLKLTDYIEEDTRLIDLVVAEIVSREIGGHERQVLRRRVEEVRAELVRELASPVIAAALEEPFQRTNQYGEPIHGKVQTLREVIIEIARDMLTKAVRDDFGRGTPRTMVEKLVDDEVRKALRGELAAVVEDEKAKLRALMQAEAAAIIGETITRAANRL